MPICDRLPEAFARRIQAQLGDEYSAFLAALDESPPVGIRRNLTWKNVDVFPDAAPIPWCRAGAMLSERPVFALDPLWHTGAYYVQEPSSMLLDFALERHYDSFDERPLLDLCAAPGGKTTVLADFIEHALVFANEPIRKRYSILRENVARWADFKIICTNHEPTEFAPLAGRFGLVLVDAPCSGEGLFRKDPDAINEWSTENAALCAARQGRILDAAAPLVAPNGLLIYSTCTYNPAENDAQIAALLASNDWENLALNAPEAWGLAQTAHGVQCWPHRVQGEGFYLAVMRRNEYRFTPTPFPKRWPADYREATTQEAALTGPFVHPSFVCTLVVRISDGSLFAATPDPDGFVFRAASVLPRMSFGIRLGEIKGKDFIPAHELALSDAVNPDVPSIELSHEDALRYLRRESPTLPDDTPNGWLLMRHKGLALGWAKAMPGRVNNYLPMDWRLRRL